MKRFPIVALLALACGGNLKLGVVPYPNEVMVGRVVLGVFPLGSGGYVAVDTSDTYSCRVDITPLAVNSGDVLMCRWRKSTQK